MSPDMSELSAVGGKNEIEIIGSFGESCKICISSLYMGSNFSFEIFMTQ